VKLAASIGLGTLPSYPFAGPIAGVVPGSDLLCKGVDVANSPIKALEFIPINLQISTKASEFRITV
jgi:hypothetical protein